MAGRKSEKYKIEPRISVPFMLELEYESKIIFKSSLLQPCGQKPNSTSYKINCNNDDVDVDVDGVYERRPKPLCPHLEITSR